MRGARSAGSGSAPASSQPAQRPCCMWSASSGAKTSSALLDEAHGPVGMAAGAASAHDGEARGLGATAVPARAVVGRIGTAVGDAVAQPRRAGAAQSAPDRGERVEPDACTVRTGAALSCASQRVTCAISATGQLLAPSSTTTPMPSSAP